MSDVQGLLIGTIFIVAIFSAAGFAVPYYRGAPLTKADAKDPIWVALQLFSAGTILAVALIHLVGESLPEFEGWAPLEKEEEHEEHEEEDDAHEEEEEEHHAHAFPLGLTFVVIGICITLGAEVLVMSILKSRHTASCDHETVQDKDIEITEIKSTTNDAAVENIEDGGMHRNTDVVHYDKDQSMWKAVMMEACIASHSIIIGVALGSITDYDELATIIVAYVFHQFFEGIALGTACVESEFTNTTSVIFGFIFAFTVPLGMIIGMSATDDSVDSKIAKASVQCIAAGSLIYTALVEMLAANMESQIHSGHVHNQEEQKKKNKNLLISYVAFCGGCAAMAILANWA